MMQTKRNLRNHTATCNRHQGQWLWFVLVVMTGMAGGVNADTTRAGSREPGTGDHLATRLSPRIASELWKSRITVPQETPQQVREKNRLAHLIQRVHSTRVIIRPKESETSEPVMPMASVQASENPMLSTKRTDSVQQISPNEPTMSVIDTPAARAADHSLKEMLQQMSGTPDKLEKPFELAELLRRSGH